MPWSWYQAVVGLWLGYLDRHHGVVLVSMHHMGCYQTRLSMSSTRWHQPPMHHGGKPAVLHSKCRTQALQAALAADGAATRGSRCRMHAGVQAGGCCHTRDNKCSKLTLESRCIQPGMHNSSTVCHRCLSCLLLLTHNPWTLLQEGWRGRGSARQGGGKGGRQYHTQACTYVLSCTLPGSNGLCD